MSPRQRNKDMQLYPFMKQRDFQQHGSDDWNFPKWTEDVSQICSQILNTIGSTGSPRIKEFPFDEPFIRVIIPIEFRFDHTAKTTTAAIIDQMFHPREELFRHHPLQDEEMYNQDEQLRNENEEDSNNPLVGSNQVQLTEVEKIQMTSSVILQYRVYIKALSKKLESVLSKFSGNDQDAVVLPSASKAAKLEEDIEKDKNGKESFSKDLDAIRELKKELLDLDARIDVELTEYSSQSNLLFHWSDWKDWKDHKEKIGLLLGQLSSSSVRQHLVNALNIQESSYDVLADIIGLQSEVADEIFSHMSNHETEEDVIHRYKKKLCPKVFNIFNNL